MPRFSEKEKQVIRERLVKEGGMLFLKYGLQKVTIDDLVDAVRIAKASFYKFYDSKEALYLDILQSQKAALFDQLEDILTENRDKPDRVRVKELFGGMYQRLVSFPLLAAVNQETVELISRKVPEEKLHEMSLQGFHMVSAMQKHGIVFAYENEVVSALFFTLYQSWICLQNAEPQIQSAVINMMLDAMIEKVVK